MSGQIYNGHVEVRGPDREYMTVTAHWAIEDPEKKSFERKNALLEVEDTYNIRKSVRK